MSNLNKWNRWYKGVKDPEPYGDTVTYQMGADFLEGCETIEDWGCGKGWFRQFVPEHVYTGIDGSETVFADVQVDLARYQSDPDGIYMRHVLEHDWNWRNILASATASFRKKFVLVLFTPTSDTTHEIAYADDPGVPDISFAVSDITDYFGPFSWTVETLETATQYGTETVFFVERK